MDLENSFNSNHRTKIVLADDHPLMRQALRMWIEKQQDLEIIAEANDGKEVIEIAGRLNPNIIVMDISMPKINGMEATKKIKRICHSIKILILTVYTDDEHVSSMMQAGADGYLTKNISGEEIIYAIRSLAHGDKFFPSNTTSNKTAIQDTSFDIETTMSLSKLKELNARELTILKLIANGFSNKEIAVKMDLGVRNVKAILTTLFLKLGVTSRTEAIADGFKSGLISIKDLNN